MEIVIVRSLDEIEAIRPIWEEMQSNQSYPAINADIDRYLSVLESQKDQDIKPYVILLQRRGLTEAMVIGRLERHPIELKLGYKTLLSPKLKCLTVVYGGILGEPGEEVCSLLIGELAKVLRRREVDVVYFNHLRTDSRIYQLSRKLPGVLCRERFGIILNHHRMKFPENLEQFYKGCSKRHRGNLRRYIRRIEKEYPDQVRMVRYSSEQELEDVVNAAARISSKTYQHGMGKGLVDNPKTLSLMKTTAKHGWLRAHVLYINNEPCAFQIGLRYAGTYFLDKIGYDPEWGQYNVGTVLFLKVLEKLCRDGAIDYYDFGFGDADYKRSYGDKQWPEASVHIFAPRPYPIFINMVRTFTIGLNRSLEYILNRTGSVGWVKRQWRNLLQVTKDNRH